VAHWSKSNGPLLAAGEIKRGNCPLTSFSLKMLSRARSLSPNFAHFGAHPVTKTFLAITRRSDSIRKNGQSLNLFSEKRRVALTRCLGADFFTTWTQVKGKTVPFCD
jgi:hypothetical protein